MLESTLIQPLKDEKFLATIREEILKAKKSIYISTFKAEISHSPRGKKLLDFWLKLYSQARLGLDIRLLLNEFSERGHIPLSNQYAFKDCIKNGIKVRKLKNLRICHAKMIIIDNTTAIIGSHNLSIKSCTSNFEVSLLIKDTATINLLKGVYEGIFELEGIKKHE